MSSDVAAGPPPGRPPLPPGPESSAALLERYRGAVMGTYGTPQRVLVRGEGCYVWDAEGNRYLDLRPVVIALANDASATGALGERSPDTEGREKLYYGSRWMVLAKHREVLDELVKIDGWYRIGTWPASRLWTDDYTDVLAAMKWKN